MYSQPQKYWKYQVAETFFLFIYLFIFCSQLSTWNSPSKILDLPLLSLEQLYFLTLLYYNMHNCMQLPLSYRAFNNSVLQTRCHITTLRPRITIINFLIYLQCAHERLDKNEFDIVLALYSVESSTCMATIYFYNKNHSIELHLSTIDIAAITGLQWMYKATLNFWVICVTVVVLLTELYYVLLARITVLVSWQGYSLW